MKIFKHVLQIRESPAFCVRDYHVYVLLIRDLQVVLADRERGHLD